MDKVPEELLRDYDDAMDALDRISADNIGANEDAIHEAWMAGCRRVSDAKVKYDTYYMIRGQMK